MNKIILLTQHYHSNSLFSGVLFLTDCKDTANIVFAKIKRNNIFVHTVRLDHKDNFDYTNKRSYPIINPDGGVSEEMGFNRSSVF